MSIGYLSPELWNLAYRLLRYYPYPSCFAQVPSTGYSKWLGYKSLLQTPVTYSLALFLCPSSSWVIKKIQSHVQVWFHRYVIPTLYIYKFHHFSGILHKAYSSTMLQWLEWCYTLVVTWDQTFLSGTELIPKNWYQGTMPPVLVFCFVGYLPELIVECGVVGHTYPTVVRDV